MKFAVVAVLMFCLVNAAQSKWVQVWSDEFNGAGVDRNKWTIEKGAGGWGN
jgi:hypothetical protein